MTAKEARELMLKIEREEANEKIDEILEIIQDVVKRDCRCSCCWVNKSLVSPSVKELLEEMEYKVTAPDNDEAITWKVEW